MCGRALQRHRTAGSDRAGGAGGLRPEGARPAFRHRPAAAARFLGVGLLVGSSARRRREGTGRAPLLSAVGLGVRRGARRPRCSRVRADRAGAARRRHRDARRPVACRRRGPLPRDARRGARSDPTRSGRVPPKAPGGGGRATGHVRLRVAPPRARSQGRGGGATRHPHRDMGGPRGHRRRGRRPRGTRAAASFRTGLPR